MIDEQSQRVDTTTPQTAQPSGLATIRKAYQTVQEEDILRHLFCLLYANDIINSCQDMILSFADDTLIT